MPSIQNLPNELIIKIAREVLSTGNTANCHVYSSDKNAPRDPGSLSRLVRTSKATNEAATPILYDTAYSPRGKCVHMMQTLIQNPDLAIWLRFLHVKESWGAEGLIPDDNKDDSAEATWAISPEQAALFNKVAKSFGIKTPIKAPDLEDGEDDDGDEDYADDDANEAAEKRGDLVPSFRISSSPEHEENKQKEQLNSILATLAIVHCKNLEHIHTTTYDYDIAPAMRVNFTFDHLQKLTIAHADTSWAPI